MMAKFNVGDKVRVTRLSDLCMRGFKVGDICEITHDDKSDNYRYSIKGVDVFGFANGYNIELVTPPAPKPKKSERIAALEARVAELEARLKPIDTPKYEDSFPLTTQFERESAEVDGIMAEIKRKATPNILAEPSILRKAAMQISESFAVGTTSPNKSGYHTITDSAQRVVIKTPNEQRADVIKRAQAFVAKWVGDYDNFTVDTEEYVSQAVSASFFINTEKRAVTVLLHGYFSGKLYMKGIAKCDPDDVFNADIGKAIALARALGVNCPEEFVKAVQPTEVVVGQRIKSIIHDDDEYNITRINESKAHTDDSNQFYYVHRINKAFKILADTDAVYE